MFVAKKEWNINILDRASKIKAAQVLLLKLTMLEAEMRMEKARRQIAIQHLWKIFQSLTLIKQHKWPMMKQYLSIFNH